MDCWSNAGTFERKVFLIAKELLDSQAKLLSFIFDPSTPRLSRPADELLTMARDLSSSEQVLVSLCVDLWCEGAGTRVNDLLCLDEKNLKKALAAIAKWSA